MRCGEPGMSLNLTAQSAWFWRADQTDEGIVMSDTNDGKIRQRAYHIWEREGRPEGREREHWDMAVEELRQGADEAPPTSRKKPGKPDAKLVAGGQGYEVAYFAKKHDITRRQAKELIGSIGNDREALNAAALRLKPKVR